MKQPRNASGGGLWSSCWRLHSCVRRSSANAIAQTNTGEVGGVVRDSLGRGAGRSHGHRQARRHRRCRRAGDRRSRALLPSSPATGQWDITASLSGFAPQTHKGVVLELGRTLNLDFRLGVEGVTENITVAVGAALLQTTTAEISDVIDNRQVVQFPLNGRNFLAPGAAQQRRRHSARRHARRCAPAGRAAAQRRRTAIGPQHLPAGRRQGHRRALQQPGDQSIGRFDPGVQDPEIDVPGGVRREGVGADQRRHQGRRQRRCTAACSSSIATTSSTRTTTSTRKTRRCRRSGRISSAARWAVPS